MRRTRKKAFVITKFKPKLVIVPPKNFLGKRIIGVLFLILGSSILTGSFFYFFLIPSFPHFFRSGCSIGEVQKETDSPQRLVIPALNLDLAVTKARIIDGQWALPANALVIFPENDFFNQKSGTIFGSNQPGVLSNLGKIKKGDRIYVFGQKIFLLFATEEIFFSDPGQANLEKSGSNSEKVLLLFSTNDYLKGKRLIIKAKEVL